MTTTTDHLTHRLVIREDPLLVARLERRARGKGVSLAAEVRAAIRHYLESIWDESEDE